MADNHLVSAAAARLAQVPEASAGLPGGEIVRETEIQDDGRNPVTDIHGAGDTSVEVGSGADDRSNAPIS